MLTCSINCLAVAGVLAVSFAAAGSTQQGPQKPAAEMSQLAYFDGTWTCSGKMFESPMGPAGDMTGDVVVRKDLNGHFQAGTIKGTSPTMPPFEGRFHATYDAGMKQFVMMWVDNMGGWSQTTSSGWKGDVFVYEGDSHMGGQTMKSRDTFTKSGAAGMKHMWEAQVNGKWMPVGEETCTKKS
ncbi:MAG: DUF1579 domain-containing protein [Acidobacteriota bacterium]|nr:DUF1579 domain-containing protein [Acidobacteriota bacterium]